MVKGMRPIDAPKFQYNGGKANLRRFIVRWMRHQGSSYVEPFVGRGNCFFLMRTISEFSRWHINDIRTVPLYEAIMKYDGRDLPDVPAGTVFEEWLPTADPIHARLLEPLLCWSGGSYETSTKAYPAAGRLMNKYRENLLRAQECLSGVRVTSFDALECLSEYINDPDAVVYLDPPYKGASVSAYSDKDVDWGMLYSLLTRARCSWYMSEYQYSEHDYVLGEPKVRFHTKVQASGRSKPAVEVLYSNQQLHRPCVLDFGESVRSPASTRSLYKEGEVLTQDEVYARMPKHWHPDNFKIEFNILQKHPNVYFDGRLVHFLIGYK